MVVRFHFERNTPAVANVDHARVFLARLDQHARPGRGKFAQLKPRIFVRTMLAPHHGEDAKLGEIRFALQDAFNALEFRRETVLKTSSGVMASGMVLQMVKFNF